MAVGLSRRNVLLRMTDQFAGQVSIAFAHPIDKVWAVVGDLDRIGEWSPECDRVEWVAPSLGPASGALFIGRNRLGPFRWSTRCEIEVWEPGREFSYVARHVTGAATRWTFRLRAVGNGTEVTERFETVGSPRFMMLGDRVARRPAVLKRGMEKTLAAMALALAGQLPEP